MPGPMRSPTPAKAVLCLLLVLTLPLAGCAQETSTDPPEAAPDGDPSTADCDHAVVTGQQDDREGHVLVMSCDGQGQGRQDASVACPGPSGAELEAGTDLAGGQVEIVVDDAGGDEIARATLSDTGGERRGIPLDTQDAEPGDWTVTIQRTEAYDGQHRLELWCPTG